MVEKYKNCKVYRFHLLDKLFAGFNIGNKIFLGTEASEFLLKHEYGHTVQSKNLGIVRFNLDVQIPSLIWYWKRKIKEKNYMNEGYSHYEAWTMVNDDFGDYFAKPFENQANKLGGNNYYDENGNTVTVENIVDTK